MNLICPKCQGSMVAIYYNEIEIDRCESCYGLWFDHLEKEVLKKLEGAESVDIGDEFLGAKYNRVEDIECPHCGTAMVHVVNHEPFDIRFEACPACHGTFFDAGEFRDYLDDEIFEQFQYVIDSLDHK